MKDGPPEFLAARLPTNAQLAQVQQARESTSRNNYYVTHSKGKLCNGFVYLMRAGVYVKVGVAVDVEKRRREIQLSNPEEVLVLHAWPCADPYDTEAHIHTRLHKYHVRGEWFKLPLRMVRALVRVRNPRGLRGDI